MPETIQVKLIEDEMKESYIDYAMSVITARALPDVNDGLKPVHRRIMYTMYKQKLFNNKPTRKCARIVGDVLGRFHPHGDIAVYDALARMAQPFSLRYPLVHGQGNFGSQDGHPPAAMRYCVTGNSLITTEKGLIPIRKISNKEEAEINLKVISYNGKKNTASKFFNSGKHKTIGIETKSGYFLEGSYNHPILVWKKSQSCKPEMCWKTLDKIKHGDIAVINRGHSMFSRKPLNLEEYPPKEGFKNNIPLPKKMNNELAFLLGALVSEGSFHNNQILFNNQDLGFYNKIKSIILSQFKGIQLYEREIKGECKELSIYEQKVVLFLKNIGLTAVKSNEKEIPFSILQSTKNNIQSFLIALFEGDGSVMSRVDERHTGKSIYINYDSKSIRLIQQIKMLLLNIGIVSAKPYKDKRNNCFKITISGIENITRFYTEIGFSSNRKNSKFGTLKNINAFRMSKTDFIPFLNEYLRKKYHKEFLTKNNFDRYNLLNKNRYNLIKLLDNKDKIFINWLLKNKFYFDMITKTEKTGIEKEVFSIKVESNCHSFIANGFISHNTEAKMSKIAEEMLADIDKDTVKFIPNYDGSTEEPIILPCRIPNLLINGTTGIAVGMTSNIPPHNIAEVSEALIALINNPELTTNELMHFIKGPDFPTGASIAGLSGIKRAYEKGRGKIQVKATAALEKGKIVITEIPYMVNKTQLIESIADLVKDKKIDGIRDLRDESDRKGMRIVIELKDSANQEVVLNQLYKNTSLQSTFGIIMIALVAGQPKILSLKSLLQYFIQHRKRVVTRRTQFELAKAEARIHILEGLRIALANIDKVIKDIKSSKDPEIAKKLLIANYKLTELQAQAILDLRLQRLTSLEQTKIQDEYNELIKLIEELKSILASEEKVFEIIKEELNEIKSSYQDKRRTRILEQEIEDLEDEDLIKQEDVVITATRTGYIKQTSLSEYRQQKRGGTGIIATETKEEDVVEHLFVTSNHNYLLFFTNKGKVHWLKAYSIPSVSRYSKGKAIINLIKLEPGELVNAILPVKEFNDKNFIMFATKKGKIKRTPLEKFSNLRKAGIKAITLEDNDELVEARLTPGLLNMIIGTKFGLAIKFSEKDARIMGRTASGVRGIKLKKGDEVIGMEVAKEDATLLTITENGNGKRTKISDYRLIRRGGKGVINILTCYIKPQTKNTAVVGIKTVVDDDEIMFISQKGVIIRTPVNGISVIGRNTQGVRLMRLKEGDKVNSLARVVTANHEQH